MNVCVCVSVCYFFYQLSTNFQPNYISSLESRNENDLIFFPWNKNSGRTTEVSERGDSYIRKHEIQTMIECRSSLNFDWVALSMMLLMLITWVPTYLPTYLYLEYVVRFLQPVIKNADECKCVIACCSRNSLFNFIKLSDGACPIYYD